VLPSASRAIVRPPEAEPVRAARRLVAIASETSGPPSIDRTQLRTMANAGTVATSKPSKSKARVIGTVAIPATRRSHH
jgi:hypothetical protein